MIDSDAGRANRVASPVRGNLPPPDRGSLQNRTGCCRTCEQRLCTRANDGQKPGYAPASPSSAARLAPACSRLPGWRCSPGSPAARRSCSSRSSRIGSAAAAEPVAVPGFLARVTGLDRRRPHRSSARRRRGVVVEIEDGGYRVERDGHELQPPARRRRAAAGRRSPAARRARRPFGAETVTVGSTATEQFLTVSERQGRRTWRWSLDTGTLEPRSRPDGSVELLDGNANSGLLDRPGRDPRRPRPHGHPGRHALAARAERRRLVARPRPRRLEAAASVRDRPGGELPRPAQPAEHGDDARPAAGISTGARARSNSTTDNVPAQNATGWYAWNPSVVEHDASSLRCRRRPTAMGWIVDPVGGATGFPAGNWSLHRRRRDITDDRSRPARPFSRSASGRARSPAACSRRRRRSSRRPTIRRPRTSRPSASLTTTTATYAAAEVLARGRRDALRRLLAPPDGRHQQRDGDATAGSTSTSTTATADQPSGRRRHRADAGTLDHGATGAYLSGTTLYYRGVERGQLRVPEHDDGRRLGHVPVDLSRNRDDRLDARRWRTSPPARTSSRPTYSWTASPSNPAGHTITSEDNALADGRRRASRSRTTRPRPTNDGSLALTGLVGHGRRSTRRRRTSGLTFTKGTDAGGSGLAATGHLLRRAEATLSSSNGKLNGTCGAFGSFATIATDPVSPYTDNAAGGIVTGKCYRYRVHRHSTTSVTRARTRARTSRSTRARPAAPTLTVAEVTGTSLAAHRRDGDLLQPERRQRRLVHGRLDRRNDERRHVGHRQRLLPRPARQASPAAAWTRRRRRTAARTPGTTRQPRRPASARVTVTNNATGTGTQTFTVTRDQTAPTGQSVALAGGPWYTSTSVALTPTDGTDNVGGSGLDTASRVYERDEATLAERHLRRLPGHVDDRLESRRDRRPASATATG